MAVVVYLCCTFGSSNASTSTTSFGSTGVYILQVAVSDTYGETVTSTISISVEENSVPLISNVWSDSLRVSLEQGGTTTVHVSATDSDGHALNYSWGQPSGANTAVFGSPQAASSTVTFTKKGRHIVRVIVSDNFGGSVTSQTITINVRK